MSKRTWAHLTVVGDSHCGSQVGVCPPKVRFAEGGAYEASDEQIWLWHHYRKAMSEADKVAQQHKARRAFLITGDVGDNPMHHGTTQSISGGREAERYVIEQVYGEIERRRRAKRWPVYVVKGTPAHSGGEGGDTEEELGYWLKSERDPDTGNWASWERWIDVNGVLFNVQHHGGKIGSSPRNMPNVLMMTAFDIWSEQAKLGRRPPDVAIRAHLHSGYWDTYDIHPTRLILTPSLQLKTAYARKIPKAANSVAQYGILSILVSPEGQVTVHPHVWYPERSQVAKI